VLHVQRNKLCLLFQFSPLFPVAVPASFHLYLLLSGTTLAQAQDAGWVLKPEVGDCSAGLMKLIVLE
jgi:hypothetical protein